MKQKFNLSHFKPYYLYRVIKWKMGSRSPLGVGLKVTYRCPLDCIHCSWKNNDEDELPTEKWKELIDYSRKKGCVIALFEGGEPTARDDLEELIKHAKNKGMITQVFTNAYFSLTEYNPDVFWVSVDGVGDKHDEIRGKGAFQRLLVNIEPIQNNRIVTWTTVSKKNMHNLEEICEFFSDKVGGMMFHFFYPYEDVKDYSLTPDEREEVGRTLLKLRSRYEIITPDSFLKNLKKGYDVYPWMNFTISPSGNVHHGCPIQQVQGDYNCSECFMACCRTPSLAYNFNMDALQSIYRLLNFKSSMLFWIKSKG